MYIFTEYTINFNGDVDPISKIVREEDGPLSSYTSSREVAEKEIQKIVDEGGIYDHNTFLPMHRIDSIVLTNLSDTVVEKHRGEWVRKY